MTGFHLSLLNVLSSTPPTITASVFAVRSFLASGEIGKGALAACPAFSMCWGWVYVSNGTLYLGA